MHHVEKLVEVTSVSLMCWSCLQREEMVYELERDIEPLMFSTLIYVIMLSLLLGLIVLIEPLMDARKDWVDNSHCPSR